MRLLFPVACAPYATRAGGLGRRGCLQVLVLGLLHVRGMVLTDKRALSWRSCCSLHGQRSFNPSSVDSSSSGCIPLPCS